MFRIWFKFMPVNPKDLDPRIPFQTVVLPARAKKYQLICKVLVMWRNVSYMHNVASAVLLSQFFLWGYILQKKKRKDGARYG